MPTFKELDVVAALRDLPEVGVRRGWVGTVLMELAPGVWEVEFSDTQGRTVTTAAVGVADLLALNMDPALG
ncbi:MAG: DUF4926 domain-containing protein [Pseudomonadota bacterium]